MSLVLFCCGFAGIIQSMQVDTTFVGRVEWFEVCPSPCFMLPVAFFFSVTCSKRKNAPLSPMMIYFDNNAYSRQINAKTDESREETNRPWGQTQKALGIQDKTLTLSTQHTIPATEASTE